MVTKCSVCIARGAAPWRPAPVIWIGAGRDWPVMQCSAIVCRPLFGRLHRAWVAAGTARVRAAPPALRPPPGGGEISATSGYLCHNYTTPFSGSMSIRFDTDRGGRPVSRMSITQTALNPRPNGHLRPPLGFCLTRDISENLYLPKKTAILAFLDLGPNLCSQANSDGALVKEQSKSYRTFFHAGSYSRIRNSF